MHQLLKSVVLKKISLTLSKCYFNKLESLVIDSDITGNYFDLENSISQYNPALLHLIIFSLEVIF